MLRDQIGYAALGHNMKQRGRRRTVYWANVCITVPALLLSGATFAFMYIAIPWFLAVFAAIYALKFTAEIWAWRHMDADKREIYTKPGHFMNYNVVLSVKMEWLLVVAGFAGLLIWVEIAQSLNG